MFKFGSFKLFGVQIRLDLAILFVLLGMLLNSMLLCSCSKISLQEGLAMMSGSELDYKMGEGVASSWENKEQAKGASLEWRGKDHDTYGSQIVKPDQQLHFFGNTEFKPECCGSDYASSGGCACMSKDQIDYINTRGGNRTMGGDF